jgi:hypothetical protein
MGALLLLFDEKLTCPLEERERHTTGDWQQQPEDRIRRFVWFVGQQIFCDADETTTTVF